MLACLAKDFVNISGSSKGRGFSGTIKKYFLVLNEKHMVREIRIDMLGLLVPHLILLGFSWEKNATDTGIKLSVLKN